MADPTTPNVVLNIPAHLSDSGTWDSSLNTNFTNIDSMYGSVTSISLSSSNVTLTTTQQQASIIRLSGTLTGNVLLTVSLVKSWIIENNCTGAFVITVTGGSGNVVGLPQASCQVYWDGANCNFINLSIVAAVTNLNTTVVPSWIGSCSIPPFLKCNGNSFAGATYPLLFAATGGNATPNITPFLGGIALIRAA